MNQPLNMDQVIGNLEQQLTNKKRWSPDEMLHVLNAQPKEIKVYRLCYLSNQLFFDSQFSVQPLSQHTGTRFVQIMEIKEEANTIFVGFGKNLAESLMGQEHVAYTYEVGCDDEQYVNDIFAFLTQGVQP